MKGKCPAVDKIYKHLWYVRNRDHCIEYARSYRIKNPTTEKKDRSEYFSRPEVKAKALERSRAWAEKNREKVLLSSEKYRKKNLDRYNSYAGNRRAAKMQATPKWLTNSQLEEIRLIYAEAARRTKETSVKHEVDHIHPLKGKTVCGLHVPWNLRVVTMTENRKKSRYLCGDL